MFGCVKGPPLVVKSDPVFPMETVLVTVNRAAAGAGLSLEPESPLEDAC